MPAVLFDNSPRSPRSTHVKHRVDWELFGVLFVVFTVLILEIALVISFLKSHYKRSTGRWTHLLGKGVVVVGPLKRETDLPLRKQISYINLKAAAAAAAAVAADASRQTLEREVV
ncbi:hypothetical protein CC86DRAFT_401746 [Ophiobolus disseminans]|uniref:Uncharacterized protein n=1 Tax=Ophiobolus disseminans TaxID=1469910 RepID=A0A6A7AES7_9PLEO|nr:hypothetical protein CC86DRAFT_401746 [Ophiobolus disseminans]